MSERILYCPMCQRHIHESQAVEPTSVQREMILYCTAQDPHNTKNGPARESTLAAPPQEGTLAGFCVSSHSDLVAGGHSSCHLGSLLICSWHDNTEHPLCPKKGLPVPSTGNEWQGRNTSWSWTRFQPQTSVLFEQSQSPGENFHTQLLGGFLRH